MTRRLGALLLVLAAPTLHAQTFTAQNVSLTTFIDVDVPVVEKQQSVSGICSTGPFSAGAPIYSVILSLHPTIPGYTAKQAPFLLLEKDGTNFAFVGFTSSGAAVDLPAFVTSRKSYPTVGFQAGLGEITISGLNWADVADVVDTLANNPTLANNFLSKVMPNLSIVIVPVTTTKTATRDDVFGALANASTAAKPLGRANTGEQWQANIAFIQGTTTTPATLAPFVDNATMSASAAATIPAGTLKVTDLSAATAKKLQHDVSIIGPSPAADADSSLASALIKPIVIVDSPCYTVRFLPSAGGDALSTFEFNGHLLAPWSQGHNFARVEGKATKLLDGTAGSTVNISGELAHNWDFGKEKTSRMAFGAIVTYDEAETTASSSRSESVGVKGSLSMKNPESLFGLKLLAGEETRPTLTFEGHYGNNEATGAADVTTFDIRSRLLAKFRWSQTTFSRIEAAGSWSEEKKFGGRDSFAYVAIDIFRMIVKNPIEIAGTYTCGRQPPDYKDNCGFKFGVSTSSNQ